MKLYDNGFSPFARKVRMALDWKGLEYDVVDGLNKKNHGELLGANQRIEVPVLEDGELRVVNSADILAYLDHRYPEDPLMPSDPALRVKARAWERCSDTVIDAILVDISYWSWANRKDKQPEGLLKAAQADMERLYDALERDLADKDYLYGTITTAELALFPHLTAAHSLGIPFSRDRHGAIGKWIKRLRTHPVFQADLERTKAFLTNIDTANLETDRIFWRGDRIEWVLARGYHDWFMKEIKEDRVIWPGLGIPE
ncbi:MAG: glutathione S-transferase family protein [Rhodospirillales bacterium]|nr:glutathione S-transferase family protein [Rhodospirillales bacterium]